MNHLRSLAALRNQVLRNQPLFRNRQKRLSQLSIAQYGWENPRYKPAHFAAVCCAFCGDRDNLVLVSTYFTCQYCRDTGRTEQEVRYQYLLEWREQQNFSLPSDPAWIEEIQLPDDSPV